MSHNPAFLQVVQDALTRVPEISIEELRQKQAGGDAFHFIDVREDNEWAAGRCQGSVHIGRGVLERDIETAIPDPQADIVLYCGGGFRSALAADSLQKMGYARVTSLAGGIRRWRELGLPEDRD
jgi:rhodanese-related sulfurtransferase